MGKPRNKNHAFWRLIRQQLRESKWSVLLAVFATIGLTLTEILRPWPLKIIFDYVLLEMPVPEWLSFAKGILEQHKTAAVIGISACLVLVALLKGTFAFAESYQMSRFGNQVAFLLRTRLFNHLQRLSLRFHSQSRMGEMLTKISGDTSTVKSFFSDSALSLASHGLIILASFTVMFMVHIKMTLLVLATFPVLVVTIGLLHRQARTAQRSQRKKQEAISSRISEVLGSVHLVQAFGREKHEQQRFDKDNDKYLSVALKNARIESAAARAVEVTSALGTAAVVAYGSLLVLKNEMTPGSILVFSSYLHGMYRPIRRLVKQIVRLSQLQVSIERISQVLSVDQDIVERPDAVSAVGVRGRIEFQQVAFAYNDHDGNVLDQLSFCIEPGQRIAVIGASGAGKSTIIGLILRLYDPSSGSVTLDGRDLRDYKLDSLRSQFSTVLQDSLLLGSTIHDNIAYGKLDANREDVIRAAQVAHVDEFVQRLPDRYDTVVGSQGSTLSGGQQRRLAIARAIIRNSPILIMDEPMTGLDTQSESAVNQQLQAFLKDKTSIVITHDLNAAKDADCVLVLERGRAIRWGKPSDVLANVGRERKRYRDLYKNLDRAGYDYQTPTELRTNAGTLSFEAAVAVAQDVDAMQTWFESYLETVYPRINVSRCYVERIRLRGGARMVVQYALVVSDASEPTERTLTVTGCIHAAKSAQHIVAKMTKDKAWNNLLPAHATGLPAVFAIPALNMMVQVFPIDRRLPGLAKLYPELPIAAKQQLAAEQNDARWLEQPVQAECVRYRSGLNAVVRYSLERIENARDAAVYAKVYTSSAESESAFAFLHQLDRQTNDLGLRCSRPICCWPEVATMVLANATGSTLETRLQRNDGLSELERTAVTLARLATSSVHVDPVHSRQDQAACLQRSLQRLKRICSSRLSEINELDSWIRYPASVLAATHRDLKLEHIFLDESQMTFIDCDSFSMADPVIDIAMLAARVIAFGQRQGINKSLTSQQVKTLASRYFDRVPADWQSRWAVHFAGALLEIAVGYYGRQEADWQSTVNFLIDQATAVKSGQILPVR